MGTALPGAAVVGPWLLLRRPPRHEGVGDVDVCGRRRCAGLLSKAADGVPESVEGEASDDGVCVYGGGTQERKCILPSSSLPYCSLIRVYHAAPLPPFLPIGPSPPLPVSVPPYLLVPTRSPSSHPL